MPSHIHPTAIVEPTAQLGEDVEVGAFAYIGGTARIGDGTRIHHHASVEGNTVLGRACEVFPHANIGGKTQDLKYKGGNPGVRIGDRNVLREYVTVHSATNDGDFTVVGDDNYVLAYGHIAHDCLVGSHVIMSNAATLGGHVIVEDHVILGGMAGIHQFCRIGTHAMIAGCCRVVQDVPPYVIAEGSPAVVRALNKIGLERRGFTPEQVEHAKQLFRILFRDGLNRTQAVEKLVAHPAAGSAEFKRVIEFIAKSERGLAPGSGN